MDGNTGEKFLHYYLTDRELGVDLALITGDAIHNLRTALDFAWRGTIERFSPKPVDGWTHFPVSVSKTKLIGDLTKTAKIDPTSDLFDFMVNRVKSYEGGDNDIRSIHTLDIDDKHQILIPVVAVTGIKGVELKNEDGSVDVFDIDITRPNAFRKNVGLGTEFQYHGKVIFRVEFGKGTPTEGLEIVPTLTRFYIKTMKIVRTLQRMR
jgi:hypothetical protein